jgi:formamidase
LLVIDLLDIQPISDVGFSGVFAKENGGGFLADYFLKLTKLSGT